ncbi:MAG TPA: DUF4038 domain-containing protein, partial [Verrucomicrobiae bacterium]|nr:DUF4038 domain-containing protein [Verrucomicrobiae bacterium]
GLFSQPQSIVPKWGRYEQQFRSATNYPNPLEDATLKVYLTSPLGENFTTYGFWDGGKVWRVRFSPNFPGKWKFRTVCSDAANQGLHNITGEFTCTVEDKRSAFDRHGAVRVARDNRHFEYEDHTPFFWLADTVGNGAIRSTLKDWQSYAQVRSAQKFTAVEWQALEEKADESAVFLKAGHLDVNPEYFRKLDAKADALNRAGLLDAIIPFTKGTMAGTNSVDALPEEQAIALLRYFVARWDANDVAWLLPCDDARPGRWKRIGRAVFGEITHAPVVVNSGEASWMLDELRAEPWVNALGYQCSQDMTDDALQLMIAGPVTKDWPKEPTRPLINLALPRENQAQPSDMLRRAAYWSFLSAPLAGVTFVNATVSTWDTTVNSNSVDDRQAWQTALLSPGATNMGILADAFSSIAFWRLRPATDLLVGQNAPDMTYIAAARSEESDLAAVYVPQSKPVELNVKPLPKSTAAIWIDPRTGQRSSVAFSPSGPTEKMLPPSGSHDWLLFIAGSAN